MLVTKSLSNFFYKCAANGLLYFVEEDIHMLFPRYTDFGRLLRLQLGLISLPKLHPLSVNF
jgi:hypothetical protein